ncbi:beta/gamma crystallin-related protein, partial [Phenylobacterium sp.]|uniref:beta/gamma crystallin-related protein n=1 Tax=Phenylobacterium sp. TaxID=1871053 RepID=UPI002FE3F91E
MTKTTLICAGLAALALAGAAEAQPRGGARGPTATLYDGPNFTGRSVTIVGEVSNLSSYNFNDKARSVRLEGRWRLCEHSGFEGRCVEQAGDIPELNT